MRKLEYYKEKKMNTKIKEEKGITLIVLVITIIILLILASVSLNILIGENGLINKAKLSRENTQKENFEENVKLIMLEYLSDIELQEDKEIARENLEKNIRKYNYEFNYLKEKEVIQIYYLGYSKIINLVEGKIYDNLENEGLNIQEEEVKLYLNNEDKKIHKLNVETNLGIVTFESSNESVAKVDDDGVVTAVGTGTCQITATSYENLASDTVNVIVESLVEQVSLDKTTINDFVKSNNSSVNKTTDKINAIVSNNDASNKEILWSSSNENVAIVDQNGNVSAVSAGNCTITAKAKDEGQKYATCQVNIKERQYLFYYGNQFSSITGGWIISNTPSDTPTYYNLGSITSNYVYVGYRSSEYWWYCNSRTNNTINTGDYNSLVMEIKRYVHAEGWQGNGVRYGMTNVSVMSEGGASGINKTSIETIDISSKHNTTGYCYINNYCGHTALPYSGYDKNSYIYLYQAYLEK